MDRIEEAELAAEVTADNLQQVENCCVFAGNDALAIEAGVIRRQVDELRRKIVAARRTAHEAAPH